MDTGTVGAVALVIASVLPTALVGRWIARRLGQPVIVVEITLCLLLGGVLVSQAGWGAPGSAGRDVLNQFGHFGLVLFLVWAAHEIRLGADKLSGRAVAWLSAGSALLPMACGTVLAAWVLSTGAPTLRGTAPSAALVLMLAISLAVTAVPVLAGILRDRQMENTDAGRLAMASAVSIDAVTWLLLAIAIGLGTGTGQNDGIGKAIAVLVCGIPTAMVLRRLAHTAPADAFAGRHPRLTVALVAVAACVASQATARLGLTDIFGAVLIGLALPADGSEGPWTRYVQVLGRLGRLVLPVLFTLTGTTLAVGPHTVFPWQAMLLATSLAIVSKLAGSYLGARIGDQSHLTGLRMAALMNTRGLTEIVVLQAGYDAHILTPGLYLALVVMALVTTALSGPLLWAVDRHARATPTSGESTLHLVKR